MTPENIVLNTLHIPFVLISCIINLNSGYINAGNLKLDEDAPFTKEQFDKEYRDALYKGCDGKTLYNQELLDVIRATYKKQVARGWIKYIHGYALIMCHSISLHEEVPMYE